MTYPATGSSGDGYEWAGLLGHRVIAPKPAAGPLRLRPNPFAGLEGTQVDCARLTVLEGGKKLGIFEGGMMITRDGVSGPAVLDASVEIVRRVGGKAISIEADFAPEERREDLAALFRRVRRESPSKRLSNCSVATGVPRRLYTALLAGAKVSGEKRPAETSSAEMHAVIEAIKRFRLNVGGGGGADECMVTVGGVSTAEVDSKTMESRVTRGVYFAGEFLDLAGPCGGFNLQCAFSTGFVAGTAEKTDSTTESTEGAQRTQRKKS
jgi:predicted Rossmann fold flavoprotein